MRIQRTWVKVLLTNVYAPELLVYIIWNYKSIFQQLEKLKNTTNPSLQIQYQYEVNRVRPISSNHLLPLSQIKS